MKMSFASILTFLGSLFFLASLIHAADVIVQLHVNRPFNDVSEKFVSFSIKPERLFKALDGPNRKSVTRMAALLGDSYLKFVGDFNFAANAEEKYRTPTKVIWKGFNRWSRAINWTMIIPVPYMPSNWEPMDALKILNTSNNIGISDCIWQLGTDFSSARAQDYVSELKTLNLMVETFKPYVDNWKVMGADVSAGSNVEETRRYIEMSKDLNEAFGWTQPAEYVPINAIRSYIQDSDPALRMLLSKKVPVWLSLPQKTTKIKSKRSNNNNLDGEEITHAFRWATTLGEAASTGFDAIFKRISAADLERPTFSFYVTALFKKVMGSRVFPSRPLNIFAKTSKLYTHCANDVSGGIAFMVVNTDERPLQISVRSLTKFSGTEFWQYSLSQQKGIVMLNNETLSLNSSLTPQVISKHPDKPVLLATPGMSVSFWVFPGVELEHCQFTEIEFDEISTVDSAEKSATEKEKKSYTSSERLLKQLIEETSLAHSSPSRIKNRQRRYATFGDRVKRFILESSIVEAPVASEFNFGLKKLFEPPSLEEKTLQKREDVEQSFTATMREAALSWLKQFLPSSMTSDLPLLKRDTRSINDKDYYAPFFSVKDGKKMAFTRKITEIRKPEKKTKTVFDPETFNEEEYFKKLGDHQEPEYVRVPEGDVHLKHITNVEGDEVEDLLIEKRKDTKKVIGRPKETVNEMKPLRLLPTEFYEALPIHGANAKTVGSMQKMTIGGALNSLLFPEPFTKKRLGKRKMSYEHQEEQDDDHSFGATARQTQALPTEPQMIKSSQLAENFLKTQRELSRSYLNDAQENQSEEQPLNNNQKEQQSEEQLTIADEEDEEDDLDMNSKILSSDKLNKKYRNYFSENIDNFFGEKDDDEESEEKETNKLETLKKAYKEVPWWDLNIPRNRRTRRALKYPHFNEKSWHSNTITKDYDMPTIEHFKPSKRYKVESTTIKRSVDADSHQSLPHKLVTTVRQQMSNFIDIFGRHVSEWYTTLTKHVGFTSSNATEEIIQNMRAD